jgi:hypothetical protein
LAVWAAKNDVGKISRNAIKEINKIIFCLLLAIKGQKVNLEADDAFSAF